MVRSALARATTDGHGDTRRQPTPARRARSTAISRAFHDGDDSFCNPGSSSSNTTTAANAAFLGSLTPLVAVVFTRFLGERLSRSTIIAIAVGLVGLLLTALHFIERKSTC